MQYLSERLTTNIMSKEIKNIDYFFLMDYNPIFAALNPIFAAFNCFLICYNLPFRLGRLTASNETALPEQSNERAEKLSIAVQSPFTLVYTKAFSRITVLLKTATHTNVIDIFNLLLHVYFY